MVYFNLVISSPEARTNLMNLAQRMIRTFCVSLSSSSGQSWTALSDCPEDTIRITTTKATEPGHPNGLILSAVSTTWLPYSHHQVFDLLRDERSRAQVLLILYTTTFHISALLQTQDTVARIKIYSFWFMYISDGSPLQWVFFE